MRSLAITVDFITKYMVVVTEIRPSSVFLTVIVQAHFPLVLIYITSFIPGRLHLNVLNVARSNLKNYPCSK